MCDMNLSLVEMLFVSADDYDDNLVFSTKKCTDDASRKTNNNKFNLTKGEMIYV